ncbi:hypothetical protein NZNM25_10310 [Nitrosopumilus zosterae]|uniref:Uncharacterized protein n=1 Tax=Nitrosopumilus zosterae TaxID=718286 RepID=A0A2S2KRD5_9ARCH|nr:hypothetical protein [Nitrosopumilus zosterae]BDQ30326.1 hypothetical protein NZOSNM25_000428 [Nitrosopumilus zosterae]GBH34240.1 hypothetical protein NZNM25_10310 [Nitrosopumilus zosterae]
MADPNFSWIYLVIFLAIPLSRIIPRLLSKKGIRFNPSKTIQERQFTPNSDSYFQKSSMDSPKPEIVPSKPQSKSMLVLGELNRGTKYFENIQKNTGLDNQELESILEDLENNGLMKVHQKQGLFGLKTELLPTDKGFKEYYS